MSETTSAPAPADAGAAEAVAPPPSSQPPISISDAARLLNQQRRQSQEGRRQEGQQRAPEARTAPPTAQQHAESGVSEAAPQSAQSGLSAMERSLGLTDGTEPPPAPANPAAAEPAYDLDGTRYTHTQLREAISKAADYTKKTQELAERMRAVAAQQANFETVLPYLQPELARLAEIVNGGAQKPDPALIQTDPQRYWQQREAYERALEDQQRLGSIQTIQQQAQARALEAQVAAANEQMTAKFPWWGDPAERSKAQQDLIQWATTKGGYTRQELSTLADARHLEMMMKAATYDKWVAGARTQAPNVQIATAPARGTPPPPAPTERVAQAEQAFDARPTFRTGAALLTARRANGSAQPRG